MSISKVISILSCVVVVSVGTCFWVAATGTFRLLKERDINYNLQRRVNDLLVQLDQQVSESETVEDETTILLFEQDGEMFKFQGAILTADKVVDIIEHLYDREIKKIVLVSDGDDMINEYEKVGMALVKSLRPFEVRSRK